MVGLVKALKNRRSKSGSKSEGSTSAPKLPNVKATESPVPSPPALAPRTPSLKATTGPSQLRSAISRSKTPSPVTTPVREMEIILCPESQWYLPGEVQSGPSSSLGSTSSNPRPTYSARFIPASPQPDTESTSVPKAHDVIESVDPLEHVSLPLAIPSARRDSFATPSRSPSFAASYSSQPSMSESFKATCLRAPMLGARERFDSSAFRISFSDGHRSSSFSTGTGSSFAGEGADEPRSPFFFAADRRQSGWSSRSYGSGDQTSNDHIMFLDIFGPHGASPSLVPRTPSSSLACPPPPSARLARSRPTSLHALGPTSTAHYNSLVSPTTSPRTAPLGRSCLSGASTGFGSGAPSSRIECNPRRSMSSVPRSATSVSFAR